MNVISSIKSRYKLARVLSKLNSQHEVVVLTAVCQLLSMADTRAVPALVQLLRRGPSIRIMEEAALALDSFNWVPKNAEEKMLRIVATQDKRELQSADAEVACELVKYLVRLYDSNLRRYLEDAFFECDQIVLSGLRYFIPRLIDGYSLHSPYGSRYESYAFEKLGELGNTEDARLLSDVITDLSKGSRRPKDLARVALVNLVHQGHLGVLHTVADTLFEINWWEDWNWYAIRDLARVLDENQCIPVGSQWRAVFYVALGKWPEAVALGPVSIDPLIVCKWSTASWNFRSNDYVDTLVRIGETHRKDLIARLDIENTSDFKYQTDKRRLLVARALARLGEPIAIGVLVESALKEIRTRGSDGHAASTAIKGLLIKSKNKMSDHDLQRVLELPAVTTWRVPRDFSPRAVQGDDFEMKIDYSEVREMALREVRQRRA